MKTPEEIAFQAMNDLVSGRTPEARKVMTDLLMVAVEVSVALSERVHEIERLENPPMGLE